MGVSQIDSSLKKLIHGEVKSKYPSIKDMSNLELMEEGLRGPFLVRPNFAKTEEEKKALKLMKQSHKSEIKVFFGSAEIAKSLGYLNVPEKPEVKEYVRQQVKLLQA